MDDGNYQDSILTLAGKYGDYDFHAYDFVNEAVAYTVRAVSETSPRAGSRHVSGAELVEGCLRYALEHYALLSPELFEYWGLNTGADIGSIVYRMIGAGILSASPEDRREDFDVPGILPEILRSRLPELLNGPSGTGNVSPIA